MHFQKPPGNKNLFTSIRAAGLALVFAVFAILTTDPASADSLDTDRSVYNRTGVMIRPTVSFTAEHYGDMYVAIVVNGALFFKTANGLSANPSPFLSGQTFSGSTTLFEVDDRNVAPGTYRLYEVETEAGADVYDSSLWHGGAAGLKVQNFTIGQPASISNDFNGDGWPDDDANHDGFHDDDANYDGYHDDDANYDGYHDDDGNHDGYHDQSSCSEEKEEGEDDEDDDGCGSSGGSSGSHNAGRDCTSCHNFSLSGTVYTDSAGSAPVQGATVTAVSTSGLAVSMNTDQLGNFYTTAPFTGPYSITVQQGSKVAVMQNRQVYGGCNTTGCHSGDGAPGRVFLP